MKVITQILQQKDLRISFVGIVFLSTENDSNDTLNQLSSDEALYQKSIEVLENLTDRIPLNRTIADAGIESEKRLELNSDALKALSEKLLFALDYIKAKENDGTQMESVEASKKSRTKKEGGKRKEVTNG